MNAFWKSEFSVVNIIQRYNEMIAEMRIIKNDIELSEISTDHMRRRFAQFFQFSSENFSAFFDEHKLTEMHQKDKKNDKQTSSSMDLLYIEGEKF